MTTSLCDTQVSVEKCSALEHRLVMKLLDFFVEAMQGPCRENQELLATSDIVLSINSIIPVRCEQDKRVRKGDPKHGIDEEPGHRSLRGRACLVLAAMIEGRKDETTHEELKGRLELPALSDLADDMIRRLLDIRRDAHWERRVPNENEMKEVETRQGILVAIRHTQSELEKTKPIKEILASNARVKKKKKKRKNTLASCLERSVVAVVGDDDDEDDEYDEEEKIIKSIMKAKKISFEDAKKSRKEQQQQRHSGLFFSNKKLVKQRHQFVGLIEIYWEGKIQRCFFPLPLYYSCLSQKSKDNFMNDPLVDLSSADNRMKELLRRSDTLVDEMENIYE
jgi:hypothetical protein